jgi:hypothetical protein
MTLREAAYVWFYIMLGIGSIYWIADHIKENAFQAGYWKGRADGWRMANRSRDLTDANND